MATFHCECGTMLDLGGRMEKSTLRLHNASWGHRFRQKVGALIQGTSLTYSEIASRLGVTGSAVSRLAAELGFPPSHERRKRITLQRQIQAWWQSAGQTAAVKKCLEMGLPVEPITYTCGSNVSYLRRTFLANGHRVSIVRLNIVQARTGGKSLGFRSPRGVNAEFHLVYGRGRFYIFPDKALEGLRTVTRFTEDPQRERASSATEIRPYAAYRNAWHLLSIPHPRYRAGRKLPPLTEVHQQTALSLRARKPLAPPRSHWAGDVAAYVRHHEKDILTAIRDPNVSLADVAQQFRVTYITVRRLADRAGMPDGFQRRFEAGAARRLKLWWATAGRRPEVKKCLELGFKVEPLATFRRSLSFPADVFLVNGHRVARASLSILSYRYSPGAPIFSFQVRRRTLPVDFQIAHAGGYFYVFPIKFLKGVRKTSFTHTPTREWQIRDRKGRKDFRAFEDAWYLLRQPSKRRRAEES